MKRLAFEVQARAYELSLNGEDLARMEGGASALLAGVGERVREADVEAAIERAEDWLMPSSKSWQRLDLYVHGADHLRTYTGMTAALTPEEVERAFSRALRDVAVGLSVDKNAIADLVLLRELVHHGAVLSVLIED